MDNRSEQEKYGGWLNGEIIEEPHVSEELDAETYKKMWYEQYEWLCRLRDSGQRTKAMAALLNMQDIAERYLKEKHV